MILFPGLERCHYRQIGDHELSETNTLIMYKHDTSVVPTKECAIWHPEWAILSSLNVSPKSSRFFFPGSDLDLNFRTVRCLDYKSSIKKPSINDIESKMDIEGGPDLPMWRESLGLRLPLGAHGGKCFKVLYFAGMVEDHVSKPKY